MLTRTASIVRFEPPPGVAVTIDGAPAAGVAELSTARGKGRVALGSYSFAVRTIGEDYYVLAQDTENPAAHAFKGTEWFPVDSRYRVRATFVPKSFVDENQLFIMFRDRTNGRETYGGGRFLHAPLPQDGVTTLPGCPRRESPRRECRGGPEVPRRVPLSTQAAHPPA